MRNATWVEPGTSPGEEAAYGRILGRGLQELDLVDEAVPHALVTDLLQCGTARAHEAFIRRHGVTQ